MSTEACTIQQESCNTPACETVKALAKDLSRDFPASPRELLGGYVIGKRTLDKCRAVLAGTAGEYHFDCPLDNIFFDFTGIKAADFKAKVASGASNEAMCQWVADNAQKREKIDIVKWNNKLRYMTVTDLPDEIQLYFEDYIPQVIPAGKVVHHFFDIYDIEEKRI